MAFAFRLSAPQLVQTMALLAALAGVLMWSSVFLTPAESRTPVTESPAPLVRSDNPALQWFSNRPAVVDVRVSGVMAGAQGAFAILAINGGPARSFRVGEQLTQGVRLAAIEAGAVVIERGAEQTRLNVTPLPDMLALPRLIRP